MFNDKNLPWYIIKTEDINKNGNIPISIICKECNITHYEYPFEPLGTVLKQDVGKLCKKVNDLWCVENKDQFKQRIKSGGINV